MKALIWYLWIHSKIWKWKGNEMPEKEFRSALGEGWNVAKKIQPLILKEFEILGMIKKENGMIRLTNPLFDEEDCNIYYERAGLFKNGN